MLEPWIIMKSFDARKIVDEVIVHGSNFRFPTCSGRVRAILEWTTTRGPLGARSRRDHHEDVIRTYIPGDGSATSGWSSSSSLSALAAPWNSSPS